MTSNFMHNDGGRAAAGYKGVAGDCVCRAIAIATERPYQEVYDDLITWGAAERLKKRQTKRSHPRTGIQKHTIRAYVLSLGYVFVPTMAIGQGCKVHLRADELPGGRLIVQVSRHTTAMIDGVIHDIYDPSRDGTRCVYGYFRVPQ